MDFGIARVLGTEHFTQGGYMMGTPAYMAPEQVLGGEIDGRADLYAVGVVLYRLLSGQLPFSADTAIAMVQKQVNDSPTPIAQFQPDLPPWCAQRPDPCAGEVAGRSLPDRRRVPYRAPRRPCSRRRSASCRRWRRRRRSGCTQRLRPDTSSATCGAVRPARQRRRGRDAAGDVGARARAGDAAAGRARTRARRPTPMAVGQPEHRGARPQAPVRRWGDRCWWSSLLAAAGGFYMLRRSTFPQQMQIGAVPTEEVKPAANPADRREPARRSPAPPRRRAPVPPAPPAPRRSRPARRAGAATRRSSPPVAGRAPSIRRCRVPGRCARRPGARGARGAVAGPPPVAETRPAGALRRRRPPRRRRRPAAARSRSTDVRVLVKDGDKARELTGVLALGDGHITVLDNVRRQRRWSRCPTPSVTDAAYSRSKQPKWKDAEGKDVEAQGQSRQARLPEVRPQLGDPLLARRADVPARRGQQPARRCCEAIESHAGVKFRH